MKLHLPISLRKIFVTSFFPVAYFTLATGAYAAELIIDAPDVVQGVNADAGGEEGGNEPADLYFRGDERVENQQTGQSQYTYSNYNSLYFDISFASGSGGAIYGDDIILTDNNEVEFDGHGYHSLYTEQGKGGAICGNRVSLEQNQSINFYNIYGSSSSGFKGGAIYGNDIQLENNGNVVFLGNTVFSYETSAAYGGAIYAEGNLSICNNSSVIFGSNLEKNQSSYRLRSIYAAGNRSVVSFSAATGRSIQFNDSIYIGSGNTLNLNADYDGIEQKGDIIFSGKNTAENLDTKFSYYGSYDRREALPEEVLNSLTSEVYTMTNLYGGRLRVEDGAIYRGYGITAMENSASIVRVQNAVLDHSGYSLTFNAGTTLELAGSNTISGNVQMLEGSILSFVLSDGAMPSEINGSMVFGDDVLLNLTFGNSSPSANTILLAVHGEISSNKLEDSRVSWVDNLLVYDYDKDTFNPYFKGDAGETTRQTLNTIWTYYRSLAFTDVVSSLSGGAIYGVDNITLSHNGSVIFNGNTASDSGGAIYTYGDVTLSNNENVEFTGNKASSNDYACGGAIYGERNIALSHNGSVIFSGNTASDSGGAIYAYGDVTLSNNKSVEFTGNTASTDYYAYGGAIYGSTISLIDNGSVEFSENAVACSNYHDSLGGGAINGRSVNIRNNDSVLFEKNVEIIGDTYRLSSIHAGGYNATISLSATAGKSIEFRDSVYIDSGSTVNLNEKYGDIAQTGDIIFTGATTVDDLYQVKGNVAGTDLELLASRTTEVCAMTRLYGGRLRVENGAIYKGNGITAMEDSASTVRVQNAVLDHSGYSLTFNAGTTLELAGSNTISGDVQMLERSILSFDASNGVQVTEIYGNLTLGDDVSYTFSSGNNLLAENAILLNVVGSVDGSTLNDFPATWVGTLLVYNYNKDTFNLYFKGDSEVTFPQTQNTIWRYYNDLSFDSADVSYCGGAICGEDDSSIMLSYNVSVAFSGNEASYLGGAIYGEGNISLSHNGSVIFSGNTASDSGGAIYTYGVVTLSNNESVEITGNEACSGGAIYGGEDITLSHNGSVKITGNEAYYGGAISGGKDITLSHNGSVEFTGNKAFSNDYAYGGAICGGEDITLSHNGSVIFSRNTASGLGGAIYTDGDVTLSNNESVEFTRNMASSNDSPAGGAIYTNGDVTLSNNESVKFTGNTASTSYVYAYGGAIYGGTISLIDNGSVEFSENAVTSSDYYDFLEGGAINGRSVNIRNNDSVLFEKNVEIIGDTYRLRSIHAGGYNDTVSLSAAAGKSIEFRDSVYIDSGSTVNLNEKHGDIAQTGDIIFTGATTVDDLYQVKGNVSGADSELLASRTTEVCAMTNLYGGRLRVEDGAIYQGQGITVHEQSAAIVRVKDAELSHVGYELEFNAGTSLEVAGDSTIRGNVSLNAGSLFKLEQAATLSLHETLSADVSTLTVNGEAYLMGASTLNASLTLAEGATLNMSELDAGAVTLTGALTFGGKITMGESLLALLDETKEWESGIILFTGITGGINLPVQVSGTSALVHSSDVFSNLVGSQYYISYQIVDNVGSLMMVQVIPEPATTTLSLLALTALVSRRRRK